MNGKGILRLGVSGHLHSSVAKIQTLSCSHAQEQMSYSGVRGPAWVPLYPAASLTSSLLTWTCVLQPRGRAKTPLQPNHSKDILIHQRCLTDDLSSCCPSGHTGIGPFPHYCYHFCGYAVHSGQILWLNTIHRIICYFCQNVLYTAYSTALNTASHNAMWSNW